MLKYTFLLTVSYIGYYFCRNNIASAMPILSQQFLFNNAELGILAFFLELSYGISKIINGIIINKFNGKLCLLSGMIGTIIFNIIFTLGSNLCFFICSGCIIRYFISIGWISIIKISINIYSPNYYGFYLSIISMSYQLGGIITNIFYAFLININNNWKDLFTYPAIILSTIFIICYIYLKNNNNFASHKTYITYVYFKQKINIMIHKQFIFLLNYSFCISFLRSVFLIWNPKIFVDLGDTISNAIIKSSGLIIFGIFSTFFIGYYTDKKMYHIKKTTLISYFLLGLPITLILIFIIIHYKYPTIILAYTISICGFFLIGPFSMAGGVLCLEYSKHKHTSTYTGYIDGCGSLAGAIAVWITGHISNLYSWGHVILMLIIISILTIISIFMLDIITQKHNKYHFKYHI